MASSRFDDDRPAGEEQLLQDGGATFPSTLETATMVDGEAAAATDEEPPAQIGRYRIEGTIGRGGMGVVYRARDPQLDRAVALKLLRVRGRDPQRIERMRKRLLREAQALAKLSHPNVVAVHDVGEVDGQVFIAMELIGGRSLRELIRAGELDRRRAIELMLAAGHGLAAAHRAGLVHRDFKPSNVVVGDDGRARVLDFGLARAHATSDDEPGSDEDDGRPPHGLLSTQLTQHGVTLGTPAYMAPEQAAEGRADERSDQYSFCVALFEALTGELPDPDPAVLTERLAGARIPRWLRALLARGLRLRPSDRYPSMDALLRDLGRDERARRRGLAVAAIVVALAAVAVWAVVSRPDANPAARCGGADELAGVWDGAARRRVRTAFDATGSPNARETYERVARRLDRYAEQWTARRRATCEAHYEHGDVSARLYDLRMRCFARRRSALEAMVRVLAGPLDDAAVAEAARAAAGLPQLDACQDDDALAAALPLPDDPGSRRRIEALQRRLDEADALYRAGQSERALTVAREVAGGARPLEHAPLTARALGLLGNIQLELGDYSEGDDSLREATLTAAEARDHEAEARAWILRMRSLLLQGRFDDAEQLREAAKVAVARAGRAVELRAEYAYNLAWLLVMRDDAEGADAQAEKSLALWMQAAGPDEPQVAIAHIMSGNTAILAGRPRDAVAHQKRAIEILTEALGPNHPDVASAAHNLASALLELDEPHDALEYAQRERAIVTAGFGADHPRSAPSLRMIGRAYLALGDPDRARPPAQRALELLDAAADANPSERAYSVRILADVAARQGRHAEAVKLYRRAIAEFSEVYGPDDSTVTETRAALAEVSP